MNKFVFCLSLIALCVFASSSSSSSSKASSSASILSSLPSGSSGIAPASGSSGAGSASSGAGSASSGAGSASSGAGSASSEIPPLPASSSITPGEPGNFTPAELPCGFVIQGLGVVNVTNITTGEVFQFTSAMVLAKADMIALRKFTVSSDKTLRAAGVAAIRGDLAFKDGEVTKIPAVEAEVNMQGADCEAANFTTDEANVRISEALSLFEGPTEYESVQNFTFQGKDCFLYLGKVSVNQTSGAYAIVADADNYILAVKVDMVYAEYGYGVSEGLMFDYKLDDIDLNVFAIEKNNLTEGSCIPDEFFVAPEANPCKEPSSSAEPKKSSSSESKTEEESSSAASTAQVLVALLVALLALFF